MSRQLLEEHLSDMRKVSKNDMTTQYFISKWTDTKIGKELQKWIEEEKDKSFKEWILKQKITVEIRQVESRDCRSTQHLRKLHSQFDRQYSGSV